MLDLSERMETTIAQFIRTLPDSRGRVVITGYDDEGNAHLKGATDTRGYDACGVGGCRKKYPCRTHGAHSNPKRIDGRTIDATSSAYGYTRADLSDLRGSLKAIGITLSIEAVEAVLLNARDAMARGTLKSAVTMNPKDEKRRAFERVKKAKRREWARANGYCVICCKNAATYDAAGERMATCQDCRDRVVTSRRKA